MSSPALRAVARPHAWDEARAQSIRRELSRFRPEIRRAVIALAREHPRLADLALSFPALLVALAWPNGRFSRDAVAAGVIAGAPLERLARAARLPLWLRKLSPPTIVAPLPPMPDGDDMRRRIVNHLPRHPAFAAHWFEAVSFAHRWSDPEFTLWCAREFAGRLEPRPKSRTRRRANRPVALERLPLFCLWAWYSRREHDASKLIRYRWTTEMSLKGALNAVTWWHGDLDVELAFSAGPVRDVWFEQRRRDGYEFVPLTHAGDFIVEATLMRNCVRGYGADVAGGERRLFSIRKDGMRVATLSVGWCNNDPYPTVEQLTLGNNVDAPPELWWLAREWLRAHDLKRHVRTDFTWRTTEPTRAAWDALWKPYWLAMGRVPHWLPLTPARDTIGNL
jgi:hypothetical protein